MRLLERQDDGNFHLTSRIVDGNLPAYAILSHRWGKDGEEILFEDFSQVLNQAKPGYQKIKFCGDQAAKDGLQYFWVDSCCIKKSSDAELSESINSMFRWYRLAAKCYVYLDDVSTRKRKRSDEITQNNWEQEFQKSQWFTRGWTLQELLAPTSVDFFSRDGDHLGDKRSLERMIHSITGIPIPVLRGSTLSHFNDDQKLSWAENRITTREEDWAYSLLGICGISMPVIYGEGRENAVRRLRKELEDVSKKKDCLQLLYVTNPHADKVRIEDAKGGLIADSYRWILDNRDFKQWRDDQQSHLLWIKGDPGKGKTMLLCGIIDELERSTVRTYLLSFFLCQAADTRINNATAVLRGLLYLLIDQQPSLISHLQKKYNHAGKTLFEGVNAWTELSGVFTSILQDPSLRATYLIIDALDECTVDLQKLLDFIVQKSALSSHVKWLVSSRNWPPIEEQLNEAGHKMNLCLELNADSISAAVDVFISHKVEQLTQRKRYDMETQDAVLQHLSSRANNTFLWVALVCQNLKSIPRGRTLAKLNMFPPGLDSLYERMLTQICESGDSELCIRILALITTIYKPITLVELTLLIETFDGKSDDEESLQEIISLCGSFLIVQNHSIYFVHQSAKDYLLDKAAEIVFPSGKRETHYDIFTKSLETLSRTLQRNIYGLSQKGCPIELIVPPNPDPLAAVRYSIVHWIDHIYDWDFNNDTDRDAELQAEGKINDFIGRNFLYWLEALSLCKSISAGVVGMQKLEALIRTLNRPNQPELVQDACRFIMSHRQAIQISPLQVYISALIFSPVSSHIRHHFIDQEPNWITTKPRVENQWSACLQTLEGHSDAVRSVVFSHDSTRLASASSDGTVRIWDASSGQRLQTLEGHSDAVNSVIFSHDSTRLASASYDRTVRIWDASSGERLQTLEGHSSSVSSVVFSHDSTRLASASYDRTVRIWDASSGQRLQTLEGHSSWVSSVVFSHDSTRLASASSDGTVRIWDASSGQRLQTLEGHSDAVNSVVFSHDSTRLASASSDFTVRIWDASSGQRLQTLEGHSSAVNSVIFSHDSTRLASASHDGTVRIWDASSGQCLKSLPVGSSLSEISFDTTGSYLYTDIGVIAIESVHAPQMTPRKMSHYDLQYQDVGLSSNREWITHNSENLIWLPSEYRPRCSAVSGTAIGIGTGSGKVWMCTLKVDTKTFN